MYLFLTLHSVMQLFVCGVFYCLPFVKAGQTEFMREYSI